MVKKLLDLSMDKVYEVEITKRTSKVDPEIVRKAENRPALAPIQQNAVRPN
jgi:hypothetical protein